MYINTIIGGDFRDSGYYVRKGTGQSNVIMFTNGKKLIIK